MLSASLTQHSFLPSLPSILRKALDKIAEIKSLLEERRIGEWEKTQGISLPGKVGAQGTIVTAPSRGNIGPKSIGSPHRAVWHRLRGREFA